jgi:hypothetical protein
MTRGHLGRYPFDTELFHLLPQTGSSRRFHKITESATFSCRSGPKVHDFVAQLGCARY